MALEYFLFRYHREPTQDFDGQVLSFGSKLDVLPDQSWVWDISYSLWRFTEAHGPADEFYKQGLIENYITWTHPLLSQSALFFQISYGLEFRHASPRSFDRLENALVFNVHYLPFDEVQVSGFVRPAGRLYLTDEGSQRDRKDFHLETGLSLGWRRWQNFSARTEVNWVWNYSNTQGEDYDAVEPGVRILAEVAF